MSLKDQKYLEKLNRYSAEVWNLCIDLDKTYREENNGYWMSRNELQKSTKGCVPLHAKGIHHVVHKYLYARDGALAAMKGEGENNKFPHKTKKHFVTGWDSQSIKINHNYILLARPLMISQEGKKTKQSPIKVFVKTIPGNIVQIELIYKREYRLSIKYIEDREYLKIKNTNSAAIDLGEIHSITSIDNNGNSIIITGRKMRSIKQERNKLQAEIYKKMSKCIKDSNQYWKYRKALNNLSKQYDKKILDCVHKITKQYVDYCVINNVASVYYGDLDSATRNTKGRVRKKTGQKLQQFNHGEITRQLENKLSRYNIMMIKVDEYYTSQKCPNCKELNKPVGRRYKCKHCNYKQHRDVVGAMNILNDNAGTNVTYYKKLKYLRID